MGLPGGAEHPRTIGWGGTVSLAMGGSNQSLFLIGALFIAQGTAAVPLLAIGLLLSWAALPGWTELIMMWPKRVGGIAATCAEAFRPYSPVLANLTGVCYWWGWVPTCGLTAILSASALHSWYLPGIPVHVLAAGVVVVFMLVNLAGVRWATRVAIPIALASATLALISALAPVLGGTVNWQRALDFHLKTPFQGTFGAITSAMAGLYLVGFAAPAFEAAACHVGETKDPERNVPRSMFAAAGVATIYFIVLPVVWLGAFGPKPLEGDLAGVLGPTFAPLLGGAAKGAAIWFMVLNMFHGTLQPLAGASRTLSQLSEDGLLPKSWKRRNRFDVPWVTTVLTAAMAIIFLQSGDPTWVIAAANLAYLIGISMPSIAVWLLRRNEPERERPYRAPRWTIGLGVGAAAVWLTSTLLGFEQFGLPTVITSMALCYAGSALYAWRRWRDRVEAGRPRSGWSLHAKLTTAMIAVIALDGVGYLIAIRHVDHGNQVLVAILQDIFVGVALLTINVGLVIPGIVSHAAGAVATAARRLAEGTLAELTGAMQALSRGDLDAAHARSQPTPVDVRTRDELGEMAESFNLMQTEVGRAATALDVAREELRSAKHALARNVTRQAAVAQLGLRATRSGDLEHLMDEIVQTARNVLGADSIVVYEYESRPCAVRVRACAGVPGHPVHRQLEQPAATYLRLAASHNLLVSDWELEGQEQRPALLREARARASVVVAISEHDRVFGALGVYFSQPRDFQADEVDTVRAIANLLASATERERAADEMRHRALHDPLTGLPNRTLFVDRLQHAISQRTRLGTSIAVLFLDIDHFKFINDSLGHSAGDELLRAIAARLQSTVRAGDTVARFGGDEFLLICADVGDPVQATQIAARTIETLRDPFALHGVKHAVSVSIGIAIAHDSGRDAEDLIREADAAMYRAKEDGRDGFEVYDEVMRAKASRRLTIESELREALERGQLRLAYQPLVALPEGRIEGVEALVRWEHPQRGLLSPDEFIPVAEQSGTIFPLGNWVLREAVSQAGRWRARHPERPLPVSVNLSVRQVIHHGLFAVVQQLLADSKLDPRLLNLEITESVLMDPGEANIERLAALKRLGVSIVLDDFGTGYSSLAYVRRFPIDTLKIDRAFVRDLTGVAPDTSIVEAIIAMARGLRVAVVAEGVETREQAEVLVRLGCTHAQGYLFSAPVWAEDIDQILDGTDEPQQPRPLAAAAHPAA
jgi:diguanylate cyclase (GGDEF)-like protein